MLLYIITFLVIFYAVTIKSRKSLHMLQQNLYNENNRYLKWLRHNLKSAFYHYDIIALILFIIAGLLHNFLSVILIFLALIILIFDTEVIKYSIMVEKHKKPLVKTARVRRQILTLYILNLLPLLIYTFNPNLLLQLYC